MGLIRFILAISVVIVHTTPIFGIQLVGGTIAVQAFYMISGFYMALILNEKYIGTNSYKLFLTNRFLRLYPTYLVVLALTFLLCVIPLAFFGKGGGSLAYFVQNNGHMWFGTKIGLLLTNLIIFGQDILVFFSLDAGSGAVTFAPRLADADTPLSRFLLIPQSWTIAVELTFYLVAPLLVRRSALFLLSVIAASLALRFFVYDLGYDVDPWTYRFFPFELAFFLAGAMGYKAYKKIQAHVTAGTIGKTAWLIVIIATFLFPVPPLSNIGKQWIYYGTFACALPFVFHASRKNRFDRWIGELSYPVYLSHWLIMELLGYGRRLPYYMENHFGLIVCLGSVAFSMMLAKFIVEPMEIYRESRVLREHVVG